MAIDLNSVHADAARWLQDWGRVELADLMAAAREKRDAGRGQVVSYSRKVFIPLTHLCRDVCGYCTFAKAPRQTPSPYLSPEEVLKIAEQGRTAGCKEALFTLGDKPELRYRAASEALRGLGHETTVEYLRAVCEQTVLETGLLPHVNAGVMTRQEMESLREVSVSQGIMLENISERLCERGGPHAGAPDKRPDVRLAMIEAAGEAAIPFTSGVLIGIGETREELIASLLALRDLNDRYGHIQEVIVQNFRSKPETRMAGFVEPSLEDLLWSIAAARLILGPDMNLQAPPNLSFDEFPVLLDAGINDWGGISPVTPDFVNPEAPWPAIERLETATQGKGMRLAERLAVYPEYARAADRWIDRKMVRALLPHLDGEGYAREDGWSPGRPDLPPPPRPSSRGPAAGVAVDRILAKAVEGVRLGEPDIVRLFAARGGEEQAVISAADRLRAEVSGDVVRYVVNRNINYTNICYFKCAFCAFSKGKTHDHLRGRPYNLDGEEIARRVREAWDRGATEVCMQGGIHPDYTGQTYLDIVRTVKAAAPDIHVHAFSPLEVRQGAETLGLSVEAFLGRLRDQGLSTLPGTAAEILDDEVRRRLCPDKLDTDQWLEVMATAHRLGLRSTATIMFGHMDGPLNWARHLLRIRDLQEVTGGFTEFVPLPFIHFEAPAYLKGLARKGPTWRETLLMYAVSRLVLHPLITNIQASWVKLGPSGVGPALAAGCNDLGGTLMDESISRAAGAGHGSELGPVQMEDLIRRSGRIPQQRTTLYRTVPAERRAPACEVAAL